jgi:ATP-dependent Clp protease ATP-binding subunit ClpA
VSVDQVQIDINRELKRKFPPEFRNRIDEVVQFQPLTKTEVREIAIKYIDEVTATLRRWNKSVTIEPEALEKLVQEGYSLAFGARFLKRIIDDRIKLPISQSWKDTREFRVRLQDDKVCRRKRRTAVDRGIESGRDCRLSHEDHEALAIRAMPFSTASAFKGRFPQLVTAA